MRADLVPGAVFPGYEQAVEKGLAGETACPTNACNLTIHRGGAGGFACLLRILKPFPTACYGKSYAEVFAAQK
jgi:hypothetical protein